MNRTTTLFAFLALAGAGATAFADESRTTVQVDGYGYIATTGGTTCPYTALDVSGGALTLTAAGQATTALDDGGAALALTEPFAFYGANYANVVVSSNGYVAFADSLDQENGGDFSNGPYLPSLPGNTPSTAGRIAAYHDDLTGEVSGSDLRASHYTSCPRPADTGANGSCTVVQWKNWGRLAGGDGIDVALVLYHASGEIAVQHASLDASGGSSACVGIQNADAGDGGAWSCNGGRTLAPASAICWFDPAHPPNGNDALFADGFEMP
jgi:hypothetical protein